MKVGFLKTKGQTCNYCSSWIEEGEVAAKIRYQDNGGFWHLFFYHRDCYVKHIQEKIEREYKYLLWIREIAREHQEKERKERRPRGRPRKVKKKPGRPMKCHPQFRQLRRRMLSLLVYHKKKGNLIRVMQLEDRVAELTRPVQ